MQPITIEATLDENHELHLTLPDLPPGRIELIVRPLPEAGVSERESAREALRVAGLLVEDGPSDDALELSDSEFERLRILFSKGQPLSELIINDREDRA
jgi:hypothetical protein